VIITTFRLEVITVLPEWVDKIESGDSSPGLSVRIARSQAAALAKNAACCSSVATRYQLGSRRAEWTSEMLTGGEVISAIASTLSRIFCACRPSRSRDDRGGIKIVDDCLSRRRCQTRHEATILWLLALRERTDCYCMLVTAMCRPRTRQYPDERRDQKSHTSRGYITRESVAAGVEESHHGIASTDSSTHQLHGDTVPE
jgi:hypothetical protein